MTDAGIKKLRDIVAEMRKFGHQAAVVDNERVSPECLLLFADRLEVALASEAVLADDEQWAPRHGKPTSPAPTAPGNATVLREALEVVGRMASSCLLDEGCGYAKTLDNCEAMSSLAQTALATPSRNCDRYATAEDAWMAFKREHEDAYFDIATLDRFGKWLFAKAEGGAE